MDTLRCIRLRRRELRDYEIESLASFLARLSEVGLSKTWIKEKSGTTAHPFFMDGFMVEYVHLFLHCALTPLISCPYFFNPLPVDSNFFRYFVDSWSSGPFLKDRPGALKNATFGYCLDIWN